MASSFSWWLVCIECGVERVWWGRFKHHIIFHLLIGLLRGPWEVEFILQCAAVFTLQSHCRFRVVPFHRNCSLGDLWHDAGFNETHQGKNFALKSASVWFAKASLVWGEAETGDRATKQQRANTNSWSSQFACNPLWWGWSSVPFIEHQEALLVILHVNWD